MLTLLLEAEQTVAVVAEAGSEVAAQAEVDTNGLIGDLAWVMLLGAIVTLLFKKLKQPVVLGYILAGFLASPKFVYLPSISNLANIDFWAEIGIVIIMFCLGLEFSFKKLMNAGSSAILTALIIIVCMTFAGFGVGRLLHLDTVNCIFLGGMISMSSTTIILKSLNDLGMRQKKFASLVLAVLIIEDLFAVLMLLLLSSIAVGNVEGSELLFTFAKLMFFLIIWFMVGVYVLPGFLTRARAYLNNETLLVVSMGLCFSMAVFSVICGFSLELGAFVMGSILAGTMAAERIEHVVQPVKDFFGAVFFISVGMMVDPNVIVQYWGEILLLAVVVVVGMIVFGTLGMLLTGQSLRVAMESGFTLTQIGEFSFIIASLGMGLHVLEPSLYPIIVAVSVITIFTTPYFIKMSQPAYGFVERHLPQGLRFLIDRYSSESADVDEKRAMWKAVLGRYLWRTVLYVVVLVAVILVSRGLLFPLLEGIIPRYGHLLATVITLLAMLPFLIALTFMSSKRNSQDRYGISDVPLIAMRLIRYLIALLFLVYFISVAYTATIGWIVGVCCFLFIVIFASQRLKILYTRIEDKFLSNLNIREETRSGRNNNIVSDLHQAFIPVGPYCWFVGDKLQDTDLRSRFGVSVSSLQRDNRLLPLPSSNTRVFPGDTLGVIGTDDQIKHLNDAIEQKRREYEARPTNTHKVELRTVRLTENSPLVGRRLSELHLRRDYYAMIVSVERDGEYLTPEPSLKLHTGDLLYAVGDPVQIDKMK